MEQLSMFAEEERMNKLSELGDCLEKLNVINCGMFHPEQNKALRKERKSNAGRPPYECVLLFKVIVLQRLYNLSGDQTEFHINDRISFMRFLNLGLSNKVPDAEMIWLFKDTLTNAGTMKKLFGFFECELKGRGIINHKGTIVDATFVDDPKQLDGTFYRHQTCRI